MPPDEWVLVSQSPDYQLVDEIIKPPRRAFYKKCFII